MKRRGFTLLEILVVVGLIALLSGLLVMGISHMQTNAKRQQTQLLLESARAMYADYDAVIHAHYPSYLDSSITVAGSQTNADLPAPMNVTSDFLNATMGSGTATLSADRNGLVVLFTRDFMSRFLVTSGNSSAMGKMSASALMRFNQAIVPSVYDPNAAYSLGARVAYTPTAPAGAATLFFTCVQSVPMSQDILVPAAPYWITSTAYSLTTPSLIDNSTPVLLDAWGNPIIFVSGGSLGVAFGNYTLSSGSVPPGSGGMTSGTGAAAIKVQVRSPDGRPFFASAGPDGDFSKGDDNLYSFEK